jgi:hypothetical protein
METEDVFEGLFLVDMKRMDVIMTVKAFARIQSLISETIVEYFGCMALKEKNDYSHQNEGDSHERAIGDEGVGDDRNQQTSADDTAPWSKFEWFVFRRLPSENDIFHSDVIVPFFPFHRKQKYPKRDIFFFRDTS